MSVSQTSSSLLAHCIVEGISVSFLQNRGFARVSRFPTEATGVFVLEADSEGGFSPGNDTITICSKWTFFPGFPNILIDIYYDYGPVKPNGKRDLIVVCVRQIPPFSFLSDETFSVHVDTNQ